MTEAQMSEPRSLARLGAQEEPTETVPNSADSPAAAQVDLSEARRFFDLLAPGEQLTFQTIPEGPAKHTQRPCILQGSFAQCADDLMRLNMAGAGIFWMVCRGDGKGRRHNNVTSPRALFLDLDGAPLDAVLRAGVAPHAVVESSPGRFHVYWRVTGCSREQFTPAQKALAARFDGDPSVTDLPRVMRVPGFLHRKGTLFLTHLVHLESQS